MRESWDLVSIQDFSYPRLGKVLDVIKVCLVECKIFFECKIFLGKDIFEKRKYFQVFGCISKNVLENIF